METAAPAAPATRGPDAEVISLWCAVIAIAVALVPVVVAVQRVGWDPSVLVRMEATDTIAPYATAADPEFKFVDAEAHYDGVYFYAIARDPFATGEAHKLIDKAAYRYGHAGYGWLGWIASFGRAQAVPIALLSVGVAGLAIAAIAFSRLSADLGWTPWAGLAVAFNPGLVYSLTALTSETVAAALVTVSLLLWVRHRYVLGALALAGLCLIKEPFVLVPAGIALWECRRWLAERDTKETIRRLALLSAGPLAFACWYVYVRIQFGLWSFQETDGFFAVPPLGWLETIRQASDMARGIDLISQVGAISAPLLATVGAATIAGIVCALRFRNPVGPVFVLLALLALALRPLGVLFPKDLLRELSIPLLLLPLVFATFAGSRTAAVARPRGAPPPPP